MSTKIQKALARLNVLAVAVSNGDGMAPDDGELISEALAEWRAITNAAKAWCASDMGELPEEHATTMESIAEVAA